MKNVKIIIASIFVSLLAIFLLWNFLFKSEPVTNNVAKEKNTESYKIIAFGDSLTAGYGLPLFESYPYQLEEILKSKDFNVEVINAGVSGETTKGNNERAKFIKDQNADMIIWGIGGNDALRALPVQDMKSNMESTLNILQSGTKKPKVLMLKMQSPLNAGLKYKKEFDAVYEELADKYNLPLIPFLVSDVFLNNKLMLEDNIHPNKEGYKKLIEDNILEVVIEEIKKSNKDTKNNKKEVVYLEWKIVPIEEGDYGEPNSKVYLNLSGSLENNVYIGTFTGCRMDDENEEYSQGKISGMLCWWAGAGDDLSVFRNTQNTLEIFREDLGERPEDAPDFKPELIQKIEIPESATVEILK